MIFTREERERAMKKKIHTQEPQSDSKIIEIYFSHLFWTDETGIGLEPCQSPPREEGA